MKTACSWLSSCLSYAIQRESGDHEGSNWDQSKGLVSIFTGVGWSTSTSHRLRCLSLSTTFLLSGDQRGE